uniref:Uncharacterized protein n=1 Tax=Bionectria ochroleuca TaxID=29856 RepID=A0A8H7ND91_BIOOC
MGAGPSDGAGNKVGCNLLWGAAPANSPPELKASTTRTKFNTGVEGLAVFTASSSSPSSGIKECGKGSDRPFLKQDVYSEDVTFRCSPWLPDVVNGRKASIRINCLAHEGLQRPW